VKSPDLDRLLRGFYLARLLVAGVVLGVFPLLPGDLVPGHREEVLTLALIAIAVSSAVLLLGSWPDARRIAWLTCGLDAVIVTAVVAATGGASSILTFLYVLAIIGACVVLPRAGGIVMGGVCTVLYTGLVLGRSVLPLDALMENPGATTALEILTMFINAGTFMTVAIVAGGLAVRSQAARQELESRRRDLRDLQAFKDLIFQSVGAGLVALDGAGVITAFNRAAEVMTGWAAAEAVGRPWGAVFGPALDLAEVEADLARPDHAASRRETSVRRRDGAVVPLGVTFSTLRSGDGRPLGVIAVCEDLSTVRALEARMRHADRLASLGRLSANIAHEIRNPLASLTAAIEALTSRATRDDVRERLAAIVGQESERLNRILKSFLDYARPAPLNRRRVNVAAVLDEVLLLVEHRAAPGTLKVVREFPPELAWPVDPEQFRQAVWNLCLNAFEAMPDGGELRVVGRPTRDRLEVAVSDTGIGIEADHLAHVFEPFYSTKANGSGLGLALVHRVVGDHGGEVDVRSTPATGTTIVLTIPARDA
jgi:two-component system sensor histidine kinase PilS (NtrC family)